MMNLTISQLKLNSPVAAQGNYAPQQNQTPAETNNNGKTNDNKTNLQEMSKSIKEAQNPPVDSKTKSAVDLNLKQLLDDERGLIRTAAMGQKSKTTCTIGNVEMTVEKSYNEENKKLTIKIDANGYTKTEVKDMKSLQNEIEAQKKENKEEEERAKNNGGMQEVKGGVWHYKTDDGRTLKVKLPKFPC